MKLGFRLCLPSVVDVRGLAKLRSRLYVLTYRPNRILVYAEQGAYVLVGEIDVECIYGPQVMVACDVSRCLYVTDSGNRCVWKVPVGDYRMVRWMEQYPWTLGVLSDGRVVMPRWGQPFSLELYRPDSVLMLRIPLPADVEIPKHIVENSKGNFVLSHWDRSRNAWGISEVSPDGEIITVYDPKDDLQQFHDPCNLSIDAENGVYVADCYNRNRVVLLDSQLKWNAVVLDGEGRNRLLFPKLLLHVKTRKQLLIVHGYRRKVIDVYNVSRAIKNCTNIQTRTNAHS